MLEDESGVWYTRGGCGYRPGKTTVRRKSPTWLEFSALCMERCSWQMMNTLDEQLDAVVGQVKGIKFHLDVPLLAETNE